ncbi:winged helix-turn-helix transcriptional regulator [Leptospira inadai]|nr:helix-turn-helix domain-containing protein [Leptospira inadai]
MKSKLYLYLYFASNILSMGMTGKHNSHCPIAFASDIFFDRWSPLILRDILFKNKRYYNEFLESEESISTNILASRLLYLEQTGLLYKSQDPRNSKRFVYYPTSKCLDLIPIFFEIIRWSARHDPETETPKAFINSINRNEKEVERNIRKQFRVNYLRD